MRLRGRLRSGPLLTACPKGQFLQVILDAGTGVATRRHLVQQGPDIVGEGAQLHGAGVGVENPIIRLIYPRAILPEAPQANHFPGIDPPEELMMVVADHVVSVDGKWGIRIYA
jgi:hypothetical protein